MESPQQFSCPMHPEVVQNNQGNGHLKKNIRCAVNKLMNFEKKLKNSFDKSIS